MNALRHASHSAILSIALCALALGACLAFATSTAYAQDEYAAGSTETPGQTSATTGKTKYAEVEKITLNKKKVKIKNSVTFAFEATLTPSVEGKKIKDPNITWSVSNPRIARISQAGVVQGKKSGSVKVTATASNGKTATARVKVSINKSKMASRVPVLTYHRICSNTAKSRVYGGTNLAISASKFRSQMKWLKKHGYYTVSTTEFRDWRVEGAYIPKKSVLLTVDDGFYETYHVALPILKKYNQKATLFCIGSKVRKKTAKYNPLHRGDRFVGWDVIKKVREEYPNLEFQSHTYNMHHRNGSGNGVVTSMSRKKIDRDFEKNEKFDFTAIAYPFGHTSSNLFSSVRANKQIGIGFGYMMDWPATRTSPRYNIPRFKVFGDRGLGDFISIVSRAG